MSDYIIKIQKTNGESCCEGNLIPYIKSFKYDPQGTNGSVSSVENTKYQGSLIKYALVEGENLKGSDGNIKGLLLPEVECWAPCNWSPIDSSLRNGPHSYGLRVIQINGFAGTAAFGEVLSTRPTVCIPLNETVTFQLFGGIGNVRRARSTNNSIISLDKNFTIESNKYEPIMEFIAPKQVVKNEFTIDAGFNKGAHIYKLTAVGIGKCLVRFTDESGCEWTTAINVLPNLCNIDQAINVIPDSNVPIAGDPDTVLSGQTNNLNIQSTSKLCSCDVADLKTQQIKMPWRWGGWDAFYPNIMYDVFNSANSTIDSEFTSTVRHMDHRDNGYIVRHIISMNLDEERLLELDPSIGGQTNINWDVKRLNLKVDNVAGQGWDSKIGPMWGAEQPLVSAEALGGDTIKFKSEGAPTNWLPEFFLVYPANIKNALGPLAPIQYTQITNDGNLASFYDPINGTTTTLGVHRDNFSIQMTTLPFIVAVHCLCKHFEFDFDFGFFGPGEKIVRPEKNEFPKHKERYRAWDSHTAGNELQGNVINNNNFGQMPSVGDITMFGKAILFHSYAGMKSGPASEIPHFPHNIPLNYNFWSFVDHNSASNMIDFNSQGDKPWDDYPIVYLTEQPRGSWCVDGRVVKYQSSASIPVIMDHAGSEKMLKDGKNVIVNYESERGVNANEKPFRWNIN